MKTISIKVPETWDWLLLANLQKVMRELWKENILMINRGYGEDFWADRIDNTADIMLQLMK